MRRILVEKARRKKRKNADPSELEIEAARSHSAEEKRRSDLLELNDALKELEKTNAELFELVMLHHFAGQTIPETAALLNISERTAHRNWTFAKALLRRQIDAGK